MLPLPTLPLSIYPPPPYPNPLLLSFSLPYLVVALVDPVWSVRENGAIAFGDALQSNHVKVHSK